jgi:hypothetical protein
VFVRLQICSQAWEPYPVEAVLPDDLRSRRDREGMRVGDGDESRRMRVGGGGESRRWGGGEEGRRGGGEEGRRE